MWGGIRHFLGLSGSKMRYVQGHLATKLVGNRGNGLQFDDRIMIDQLLGLITRKQFRVWGPHCSF